MAVNNSLTPKVEKQQMLFSQAIRLPSWQNLIRNTLGDSKKATRFITAITSAVSANPKLQECEAGSILSAGFLGETLNLSPSPQLGMYYIVPYKNQAQFQLGYKGYIQLAIRSGQYRRLNVLPIKQGELVRFNPLEEEIEVNLIEDETARENTPTTGYYAFFEYLNGFRKAIYWSKEKMESHAKKYSKGYQAHKGYTFWEKDFDGMACKTMLRQLISKWGMMSVELEKAVISDMAVIKEDGSPEYIDNPHQESIEENENPPAVQSDEPAPDLPEQNENPPIKQPEESVKDFPEQLEFTQDNDFASIMEG